MNLDVRGVAVDMAVAWVAIAGVFAALLGIHEGIHLALGWLLDGAALADMRVTTGGLWVLTYDGVETSPLNWALTPALSATVGVLVAAWAAPISQKPHRLGLFVGGIGSALGHLAYGVGLIGRGPHSDALNAAEAFGLWAFAPEVAVAVVGISLLLFVRRPGYRPSPESTRGSRSSVRSD